MCAQSWMIEGALGQPIYGVSDFPDSDPIGMLILCHGFKGYKDYGLFPYLAQQAANQGLLVHRFNFSHSGMTENIDSFERPELFAQDSYAKQIIDLSRVSRAIRLDQVPGDGVDLPMVWFGHSRGGVAVVLTAARVFAPDAYAYPPIDTPKPIAGVISAAGPCQAVNWDQQTSQIMRQQGYLDSPSARTGQNLRVNRQWLDEIEEHPEEFDPLKAMSRITCPVLIVHGDNDQSVPVDASVQLADVSDHAKLQIIAHASHTFNAPNPIPAEYLPESQTQQLVDAVCDFSIASCTGS
jgi:pimeloyl-ACP methyl ester carboxylesterase